MNVRNDLIAKYKENINLNGINHLVVEYNKIYSPEIP